MAAIIDRREVLELSGYLTSVASRLQALQHTSSELSLQINQMSISLVTKRQGLSHELKSVKQDIISLREEVRSLQKAIIRVISELKSSVKADELDRFKKRIELWAPEHFVTKNEARRALEDN